MFRVDLGKNRISRLEQVRFCDLGYTERNHLQEWLANQPDALGEELLIIQKEFDGFDDTRERLDLLAIDKQGALVIIENKLDDSGRNVVWQSLKYASYCSTLSKSQVAGIFQKYLDKYRPGDDAKAMICEFLGEEDFADVVLNPGNDQRLILVAAQFRKEVTSTVLWLRNHKIRIKCFRATPFRHGESIFLNLEQIIPLQAAEELMIGISEKESEEQSSEKVQVTRFLLRTEFWQKALQALERANVPLYSNVSASRDHWLNAGSGLGGVMYTMIFNRDEVRVDFTIARASKEQNKRLFDVLIQRRSEIEGVFGAALEWRRNDEKKVSTVAFGKPFSGHEREHWPEMIEWLVNHLQKMHAAFSPHIPLLRKQLRTDISRDAVVEATTE